MYVSVKYRIRPGLSWVAAFKKGLSPQFGLQSSYQESRVGPFSLILSSGSRAGEPPSPGSYKTDYGPMLGLEHPWKKKKLTRPGHRTNKNFRFLPLDHKTFVGVPQIICCSRRNGRSLKEVGSLGENFGQWWFWLEKFIRISRFSEELGFNKGKGWDRVKKDRDKTKKDAGIGPEELKESRKETVSGVTSRASLYNRRSFPNLNRRRTRRPRRRRRPSVGERGRSFRGSRGGLVQTEGQEAGKNKE